MQQFGRPLYAIALTLWVGALWAVGAIVAPTLFSMIDNRSLAGAVAGRLFTAVAWVGIGCAIYLMLFQIVEKGAGVFRTAVFWIALLMFLLTLAGHFGVQPIIAHLKASRELLESVTKERFDTWHGIASILYVIQSALGGALVVLESARR